MLCFYRVVIIVYMALTLVTFLLLCQSSPFFSFPNTHTHTQLQVIHDITVTSCLHEFLIALFLFLGVHVIYISQVLHLVFLHIFVFFETHTSY